jgi:hypothetical protein
MLRAAATPAVARLLAASAATGMSHTGNTNETALATISVSPPGPNGGIEVRTVWSYTNSGNNKTLRVRLGGIGGTAYLALVPTTTTTLSDSRRIRNRNSNSSQVGSFSAANSGGFNTSSAAVVTSSTDWSAAVDLVISAQLASAGETITLESYEVWLLP